MHSYLRIFAVCKDLLRKLFLIYDENKKGGIFEMARDLWHMQSLCTTRQLAFLESGLG